MNLKRCFLFVALIMILTLLPLYAVAQTYFSDDFESYSSDQDLINSADWTKGDSVHIETDASECVNGTKCVRIDYVSQGSAPYYLSHSVSSLNLGEIHIRFYFKVRKDGPDVPEGAIKFCKLFGKVTESPTSYANSTLNLGNVSATPVVIHGVSYGKGDTLENDTQDYVYFDGTKTDSLVSVDTTSTLFYPVEDTWYTVEVYMKYNTDDNRDGAYKVWVNGVLRMSASNIKNRNNADIRAFDNIVFGDYANQYINVWSIWYDDIVFSDSHNAGISGVTISGGTIQ